MKDLNNCDQSGWIWIYEILPLNVEGIVQIMLSSMYVIWLMLWRYFLLLICKNIVQFDGLVEFLRWGLWNDQVLLWMRSLCVIKWEEDWINVQFTFCSWPYELCSYICWVNCSCHWSVLKGPPSFFIDVNQMTISIMAYKRLYSSNATMRPYWASQFIEK